jgi:hypothetical protein
MKIYNIISGKSLNGKIVVLNQLSWTKTASLAERMFRVVDDTHQTLISVTHILTSRKKSTSHFLAYRGNIKGWITDEDADKFLMWEMLKND